uniref:SH3 domain and tetratricopeptide repeats 1 n=1 Tax=Podarcis muralis TaxID=64176 RepID=A0A670JCB6_PODMU
TRKMFSSSTQKRKTLSSSGEDQLIVVTFWTFEEIWKFVTYYSLGFLNHCMENLLLDDYFWLSSSEESVGIDVSLDEECLGMIYRGLLIQEVSLSYNQMSIEIDLMLKLLLLLWQAKLISLNLSHARWFLKENTDSADFAVRNESAATDQIGNAVPEEIGFQKGDRIEIIGYFMKCMKWFVGRHAPTGQVGFTWAFITMNSYDLCFPYFLRFSVFCISEMSHSFLNKHSGTMKDNMVHSLMKVRSLQLHREEVKDQKRPFSASDEEMASKSQDPHFCICPDDGVCGPEILDSLLLFLNCKGYESSFKSIYDLSFSFLSTLFHGYASEEDLVDYFVLAREAAKRASLPRALARLCYLLGRMSVRKFKLSQARVYFEEALATTQGDFSDLFLIASLYTNLTGIYLKQKNKEKCACFFEKVASLLMGIPNYISSNRMESDILKYALKRAVLSQSKYAEARACFLLAKHYLNFCQGEEALPFLERLQLLSNALGLQNGSLSVDCYFKLGPLYSEKCLPHLVLSCVKVASSCSSCTLLELFRSIDLVFKNAPKVHCLKTVGQSHPSQTAYYLRQVLHLLETSKEHPKLCSMVCCYLSLLYSHHKQYGKAIDYMEKALDTNAHSSSEELIGHLVFLSWLYILHQQNTVALDILNAVVENTQSSHQQLGIVYNMIAIVLKRMNDTKQAAESYYKALSISREMGIVHNQAVALANLGILCLHSAARSLGEHFLIKAVTLFSELPSVECGRDFIYILLRLGCYYASGFYKDKGRCCFEWAFLVAMEANHLEGQLQAVQHLCQFYSTVLPDEALCVVYNEYQLSLVRKLSDKVMEGQILETISQLYLSLGTERAYRSALEYTKRSLGIFIDLQAKEREAQAWLQAGKIYYKLRQNELVDLYIQVAQNAALCTHDPNLQMELFEASGDIFFNGEWEKEKAVPFYRVGFLFSIFLTLLLVRGTRLRFAVLVCFNSSFDFHTVLILLLTSLGNLLNERIAFHRLAVIYHHLGQVELTEHFFLKALSLCSSPLEFDEEALYYVKVYLVLGDITFYDLKVGWIPVFQVKNVLRGAAIGMVCQFACWCEMNWTI